MSECNFLGAPQLPPSNTLPYTPRALEALYAQCRRIYPDQGNPLQVTAVVKYWLGGPDPLDYISMYENPGNSDAGVPAHWHFVSFGLSDLHGDGRVHEVAAPNSDGPSGFGFELTLRLKREPTDTAPPTWPATVMQALAKYVFASGNVLCPGDHVSWHCALDNSVSRIQHMLMCIDPQLGTVRTPFGEVTFVQIVGVTKEELKAAQHWNGPGVLDILKKLNGAGGEWLVTDMRRGESMLELDPSTQEIVDRGIEEEGSNLSGVSARCSWAEVDPDTNESTSVLAAQDNDAPRISELESQQIKSELTRGLMNVIPGPIKTEELEEEDSHQTSKSLDYARNVAEPSELVLTRNIDVLHLTFNLEAGYLLPLAVRGRVKHGRHFTFKCLLGDTAITFVAASVTGTFVTPDAPYAANGPWLQVLIPNELAEEMSRDFEVFSAGSNELSLPTTFMWPFHKLSITIVPD